jgi:zinc protease
MTCPVQRRRALASALVLPLSWLAASARATPGTDEPPLPQPPRPLQLPAFSQQQLANGLTVLVAPRPGLPILSLTLALRAGPEADPAGHAGVAEMLATLWPKGALRAGRRVGASELARQAEALGSALESRSSWGAGTLAMTVTSSRAEAALALLADVLRRPLLAQDELARARSQAQDSLRLALGNPGEVAAQVLRRVFWGDVPHGRVATPAALQRLSLADLRAFQARWVRPDRVALVLAGDTTPEAGLALAQRLLGHWRAATTAVPDLLLAPPQPLAPPLVLVDLPGAGQTSVAVAAPFVAQGAGDRRIGLVANAVLGGGYSARLNQEVRIRRGLSYGAGSSTESFAAGGMASAQAQTSHANAAQVLQLLRSEITRLAEAPAGADELAARQATLVGGLARRLETSAGLSALLVGQWAAGRPLAELADHVPQILAVTPAQVQDFARRHWTDAALRAVVVGDLAASGDALAAANPGALRLRLADLDLDQPGLHKPG